MRRGEVWVVDLGMVAKVRPCLLLTNYPEENERALVTVLLHTTAVRSTPWEIPIQKNFLKPGAFDLQQLQTVGVTQFVRQIGVLTESELMAIWVRLLDRFGSLRLSP